MHEETLHSWLSKMRPVNILTDPQTNTLPVRENNTMQYASIRIVRPGPSLPAYRINGTDEERRPCFRLRKMIKSPFLFFRTSNMSNKIKSRIDPYCDKYDDKYDTQRVLLRRGKFLLITMYNLTLKPRLQALSLPLGVYFRVK